MLRPVKKTEDWERLAARVIARTSRLGLATLISLERESKTLDQSAKREGVSVKTWSNLIDGKPISRTDKLALVCRTLRWDPVSIDMVLAGGEPIETDDDGPVTREAAARLDDQESRLRQLEVQMREAGSHLRDIQRRVQELENTVGGGA